MKIKTLRRIEIELDNELVFISRRLRRENNQATKELAELAGVSVVQSSKSAFSKLVKAKFEIRNLVAEFNIVKGINAKTAKIAELEALGAFVEEHLIKLGKVKTTRNYGSDTYEYAIGISDEVEDNLRAEVRRLSRQVQSLKDSCNGINSQGDIQVSDSLLSVFKAYSLVD